MIIPYSQEDLTWIKRSIVAIRKTQNLENDPKKESLPTRFASSESSICQLSDAHAMTAHSKSSEAISENTVPKSKSNLKAGKCSIFDPIEHDPSPKLQYSSSIDLSNHSSTNSNVTGNISVSLKGKWNALKLEPFPSQQSLHQKL